MAEVCLCFSSPSSFLSPLSLSKQSTLSSSRLYVPALHSSSSRCLRFSPRASSHSDGPHFGFYPWDHSSGSDPGIEWVSEERVTLFTADGLVQIGGSLVPKRVSSSDRNQGKGKTSQRFQRFQESNYMDPAQGLCLGALFDIAATNGLDTGRRLCIIGFCRSIEMLSDVVEDTVLEHGGEVVTAEKASKGGLHEKLKMTVAVPLLWGVPPVSETLHLAVRSGGGIVDKVFWQWDFL
ncbi:D-tagatose-1,6-bisphosphate aldolase subunit [Heracleum sosnowskyi]|uniref:D-tagatose-1,6-bisphosphate aldolase subunit n=1 Tax=Heracleum sosnowskyi TaxID=360622 RepID=A0AAD8NA67_9APIA|nr:D-tagatose-1,6-bisphosphate aldolase subunit [Heracleum sosnowskyi]